MKQQTWERMGAATGVGFALFAVIAYAIPDQPPTVEASITEKVAYFATQRTELLWQTFLFGMAAAMLLWFAGSVRHALWKAEGDTGRLANVAFGGAIAAMAVAMGGQALIAALAYNLAVVPGAAGAISVLTLYSIVQVAGNLMWFPAAVFVGATSIVAVRHRALSPLIGVVGIPLAVAMMAAGGSFRASGAAAPGGLLNSIVFLVFLAWTIATSVAIVAQIGTVSEPRTIYLDQPQRERLAKTEEVSRTA
jgi:hypothetical protein